MQTALAINIVFEDYLSESVIVKILAQCRPDLVIAARHYARGFGFIKRTLPGFNKAARGMPCLVLSDLEAVCPPTQVRCWLPSPMHPNLIFRIAVPEVESWILADRQAVGQFLGISFRRIPQDVESATDPKRVLVDLARSSPHRGLRDAIVPRPGSTAQVGPDYNGRLSEFVGCSWDAERAAGNSPSLRRAIEAISGFQPNNM